MQQSIKCLFCVIAVMAVAGVSDDARATTWVHTDFGPGLCTTDGLPGAYYSYDSTLFTTREGFSTSPLPFPTGSPVIEYSITERYVLGPQPDFPPAGCVDSYRIWYEGSLAYGPRKGTSPPEPPRDWTLYLYGRLRSWISSPRPSAPRNVTTPGIADGVRGSLGFSLLENSPDSVAFDPGIDLATLTSLDIPFVVNDQGDGDWLSMAIDGEMFWKMPLSDFEVDVLNWASVPTSLLSGSHHIFTYYLESTGATGASVYFPTEFSPVPIPAAAWLFGGALGALGWVKRRQAAA